MWTIPTPYVDRLRRGFPRTPSSTPATMTRRWRSIADAEVVFTGQITARAAVGRETVAVAPQSGGRRRRDVVSGDGRQPGRPHELARDVGRHDRGARPRGHAGALSPAAARVPQPGGAGVVAGRDRGRGQSPDCGRARARRRPGRDRRRGRASHDAARRARDRPAAPRGRRDARRMDGRAGRAPPRTAAGGRRGHRRCAAHARDARADRPRRTRADGADAILVNVSRGQLIDEPALIDALGTRTIGGAALDVFVDEPLPPDSPFWTLPNVLITPHTSGFRPDHWDAAIALFAENLERFDAGQPLVNVVDKTGGL